MESKATYTSLKSQIEKLQAEANEILKTERGEVIGRIKEAITVYSLTAKDLGLGKQLRQMAKLKTLKPKAETGPAKQSKPKPKAKKYSDGQGNQWDGKGEKPDWINAALGTGRTLADFATKPLKRPAQ